MRTLVLAIVVATIATIAFGVVRSASTSVQAQEPDVFSDIVDFALEDLTVPVGTTVTWTNVGFLIHTSTSGIGGPDTIPAIPDGIWDSGDMIKDQTFSFTFNEVGEFPYYCIPHASFMIATVTVEPATEPIPSLSTWGLISLATLLAGFTLWKIIRKKSERLSDGHIVGGA